MQVKFLKGSQGKKIDKEIKQIINKCSKISYNLKFASMNCWTLICSWVMISSSLYSKINKKGMQRFGYEYT
jgi:hypothetical protein